MSVLIDGALADCLDNGQPISGTTLSSIVLQQAVAGSTVEWVLARSDWHPDITIHNSPSDTVTVIGSAGADQWQGVAGTSPGISLDGQASDAELLLDGAAILVRLQPLAGDDVVDLTGLGSTLAGHVQIHPGEYGGLGRARAPRRPAAPTPSYAAGGRARSRRPPPP